MSNEINKDSFINSNRTDEKMKNQELAEMLNLFRRYIGNRILGIYEDNILADRLVACGALKENSKLSLDEIERIKNFAREEVNLLIGFEQLIQENIRKYSIY